MNPGVGATANEGALSVMIIWRWIESTSSWSRQLPVPWAKEKRNRYRKRYRTWTACAAGGWRKRDDFTRGYPLPKARSFFLPEGLYSWHLASFYLPGSLICQALAWCRLSVDSYGTAQPYTFTRCKLLYANVLHLIYLRIIGFDRLLLTILLLIPQAAVRRNFLSIQNFVSLNFICTLCMKITHVGELQSLQCYACDNMRVW